MRRSGAGPERRPPGTCAWGPRNWCRACPCVGRGEGQQLPRRAGQPERRSQTALPNRPAVKGRRTPAKFPAQFPTTRKCTSHRGFSLAPNLMPRIWRQEQEVEDAVQTFCEYSGIEGNDGEEWARRNRIVESLSFYLNKEQCDRVNKAYEKEMDRRLESGGFKLGRKRLQPNPDKDDSYSLDSRNDSTAHL